MYIYISFPETLVNGVIIRSRVGRSRTGEKLNFKSECTVIEGGFRLMYKKYCCSYYYEETCQTHPFERAVSFLFLFFPRIEASRF